MQPQDNWTPPSDAVPVKKQGWTPPSDAIPNLPKKVGGAGSPHTSPQLPSGLGTIPDFRTPTNIPYTTEYVQQQQEKSDREAQQKRDAANTELSKNLAKIDPATRETWQKINQATRQPDQLRQPSDEEIEHWKFMDTPIGKVVGATKYLTSKASKGALDVVKGAAHEWNKTFGSPYADIGNDIVFNKADQLANLGQTKNDIAQAEDNKALSTAGMMAEFAPTIAGGEALKAPRALMFLQGVGQGKDLADKLEIDNPVAKEALIQGTGVVNLALSDIKLFGKLPNALRGNIATGIALDALKESAGKDLSSTEFKDLLMKGANTFAQKLQKAPLAAAEHYMNAVKSLTKLNVGNFALHKAVDAINDKPVFNESPGSLAENEYKAVTQDAPMFAAIPAARELSKLTPLSSYKNSVVEHLLDNPNDAESVKSTLEEHGKEQGWSPEEIKATKDHIDNIASAVKSLPPDLAQPKKEKAVGLVLDRNDLQKDLDELQSKRSQLDPSLQETASSHEQFLTDKIDQANDKIRQLVTGKRTTYSKDEQPEKPTKYYKTTDGQREEITPSRYDLENLERTSKQQNNEVREQQNGQESRQEGNEENGSQESEKSGQKEEVTRGDENAPLSTRSDSDIEKRMFDIETSKADRKEFNLLEKEMERRERESIFSTPLEKIDEVITGLQKKEKEKPNGFGSFIEKREGEETIQIANRYLNKEKLSDSDIKNDFKEALLGNPDTWASDGLKLRESAKVASERGINIDDLLGDVEKEFIKDGFSSAEAKEAIASRLAKIIKKEEPTNAIQEQSAREVGVRHETTVRKGVGGQNEPEVAPQKGEEENLTSIKNEKIDRDREKRGLSPLMSEAEKDFPTVWKEAMNKLDDNPKAGEDLVNELHEKPRATTDTENALIAHTLVEAKNRYDKANEAVVKAQDAGEDTEPHEAALQRASDDLQKIEETARKVGTESGRGLNSRKMMIRDDMSLANLETQKRVALGRKLTPEEREDLRKVHEEYQKREKEYQDTIDKLTQKNRDLQERQQMEKLKSEAKKEARAQRGTKRASNREQLVQDIRAKLKVARTTERLNVSIPFAQQVAELYKISPELAKLAKSYIAEGIDKLDELVDKIHEHLQEYDKRAIRDALSGYGKPVEKETKPELEGKLAELKRQAKLLSKLEDLQAKEYKAPQRKKAQISQEIADLKKQVRELEQPDISLKSIKTRTANQIKEYERRLREKDFEPTPKRPPTELDPEAIKAKAELNRVKDEFNAELEKGRLARRGNWEKGWDKFLKYRRAELLLNLSGAAKVGMASMYRILSTPLHEIAGSGVKLALPGVAEKAAREGHGFVPEAEWKALKSVWSSDTLAEVKKKFKGQLDNLDTAFGDKKEHFDTDRLLDLAGNIHAAEKEFAKQNEFRRSVLLRTKWAEEHGVDTQNPFVQLQIGMKALEDANRQIFMADNVATTSYRTLLNYLESKSAGTKFGTASKISAGVLKLMLPIVKVPTNYLIEKAQYTPVLGALKALNIMRKGLDNMTPDQADYVMRVMKKQGIGAGLLAIGYMNPKAFGGFYIPGKKRDPNDELNANDVKIFGVHIPHYLTHTPLLTLLQLGATIRRASAGETAMGTVNDFVESTPFYETPKEAVKAMESSNSMTQFVGNTLRGLVVPNMVSQAAQHYDTDEEGNEIKRSPKSIIQGIETGIPGLRQNVPIKSPHPDFDKITTPSAEYKLNNKQIQERQKFYDDFMKTEGAKNLKLEIAKTTDKKLKEKLSKRLKEMASKVSKRQILSKYHNSETGGYDIEKVEE